MSTLIYCPFNMKKTHITIVFTLILLCYTSCKKYSYIENELHGLWQVTSVENKATGEITEAQGELYYSFQRNMVMLGYKSSDRPTGVIIIGENTTTYYVSEFNLEDNYILMGDFRIYMYYDKKVPLEKLEKFGIYDEYTTFSIERTSKNSLVFESEKSRIIMRRY